MPYPVHGPPNERPVVDVGVGRALLEPRPAFTAADGGAAGAVGDHRGPAVVHLKGRAGPHADDVRHVQRVLPQQVVGLPREEEREGEAC